MIRWFGGKTAALVLILSAAMVFGACSKSYEYTSGDVEWRSTCAEDADAVIKDTYYYSDGWFSGKPETENKELALCSMQLAAAAVSDDADGMGAVFLRDMGFDEVGFSDFESSDPDDFNYTWAKKDLGSATLVAVAVQSTSDDPYIKSKVWKQNFTVNDPADENPAGEHYAFAKAADSRLDEIASLGGDGRVKYWITGHSRGGAIANILAARLADKLGDNNDGIYAYTFEAPATVDADSAGSGEYKYIHNYICSDDIVTMMPAWGMTRYGVMHELRTKETDAGMDAELEAFGSGAAGHKNRILVDKDIEKLMANIEAKVPSRAEFSKQRTDRFTDAGGESREISYSWQDALCAMVDMMNGGGEGENGIDIESIAAKRSALAGALEHMTAGVKIEKSGGEPCSEYWEAASQMNEQLAAIAGGTSPLSTEDVYKIVSFMGPVLIEIPEDGGEADMSLMTDVLGYSSDLTYSHHFDTVTARLKVLAPAPAK